MSDLLTDLDLAPEHETLKEPPKRWRNWWETPFDDFLWECHVCGHSETANTGDVHATHCRRYPSKDIAQSIAATMSNPFVKYLGAFPEDSRP